jgi:hypothetical protein
MKLAESCPSLRSGALSTAPGLAQTLPRSEKADVSIIVPMYRSSETVRELHERISRVMGQAGAAFELILVDDGCPAGSGAVGREVEGGDSRVRIVSLPHNRGQHRAVLAGLTQARGEWCLVMDADLQDPPEAIPALLAERSSDVGAIFAGRRGRYESRGRLLTSWLFKTALSALCGVPRDAGMFVLLQRGLVEKLLAMSGPEPFVVAMIGCSGFPVRSIPMPRAVRPRGSSAYSSLMRLRCACRGLAWAIRWRWHALFR